MPRSIYYRQGWSGAGGAARVRYIAVDYSTTPIIDWAVGRRGHRSLFQQVPGAKLCARECWCVVCTCVSAFPLSTSRKLL